jgi:ADP-heptose:LPS heptosyltransferase
MVPVKRLLIFRIGQLGDTLVGIPALRMIREHHPEAEIHLLFDQHIGKSYVLAREVLSGSGLIDEFIPYPVGKNRFERFRCLGRMLLLLFRLRKNFYEIVYHLEPGQKTSKCQLRDKIYFRLAGICRQVISSPYRQLPPVLKPLPSLESEVDFYIRVLRSEGLTAPSNPQKSLSLESGPEEVDAWMAFTKKNPLPEGRTYVAVGAGSKMESKKWPEERFIEVLLRLREEKNIYPLICGGPEDSVTAEHLISMLGEGHNLCGAFSPLGTIHSMRVCALYLGNDTGTMHLAVSAGLPCVAVFSARDYPGKWYPYGQGHIVHRIPVACEGCMLTTCVEKKKRCLTQISAESVVDSCITVLSREHHYVPLLEVIKESF